MDNINRHSKVELVDYMGSDLTVVNAARVSFNKESDWEEIPFNDSGAAKALKSGDEKLITYLAEHGHWSPFSHCTLTFRISAPIFVARQLVKHQIGLAWNEVSRRYVTYEPAIWFPTMWRRQDDNKKQGSTNKEINSPSIADHVYEDASRHAIAAYESLINLGVCAEQARAVLPQAMFTEWYWTGSLYAFARVYNLRTHSTAQAETKEVAIQIGHHAEQKFPVSWYSITKRLNKNG